MRSTPESAPPHISLWGKSRWLAVALTLFGWAVMTWRLGEKSLWWDESLSLYRAQQNVATILAGRIDFPGIETIDQHPPLYFLLLKGILALGGEADVSLRLPSALFGALLVPLLYAGGCLLRNRRTGLWAACLGALSPFYLWYAQEARMYTMVTVLTLGATLALWWAIARARRWGWVWFGLLAALSLLTHYLAALLLVYWVLLVVALWRIRPDHNPKPFSKARQALVGLAISALIAAILFGLTHTLPLVRAQGAYEKFLPLPIILRDAFNSYSLGLSVIFSKHWPLLIPFGVLAAIGLFSMWAWPPPAEAALNIRRMVGLYALLGYMMVPALLVAAISYVIPFYKNSRYLMASSPAFYLAIAAALEAIGRKKPWVEAIAGAVLCALMLYSSGRYFFDPRYASKEDYRGVVQYIEARAAPGDAIVLTGVESQPAFEHYYRGKVPLFALPRGKMSYAALSSELANLVRTHNRIWHIQARRDFTDPSNHTERWLEEHAFRENTVLFPSAGFHLSLKTYLPRSVVESAVSGERLGSFEGGLHLERAEVRYWDKAGNIERVSITAEKWGHPEDRPLLGPVTAGDSLGVTLTWGVDRPLPELHLSLRLVQGSAIWAQADQPPLTEWPTDHWKPGKRITHVATLPIPADTPAAEYWLQIILYRQEDAQPLSFREASTGSETPYLLLGPVSVVRPSEGGAQFSPLPAGLRKPFGGLVFEGGMRLLAYGMGPTTAQPGERVTLHLYWQAECPQREDALLVVNWADANHKVWHTETVLLVGVADPPTQWPVGARLHGVISLIVPAEARPGSHSLHILVRSASGKFLWVKRGPFPWAGRDVHLGQITVTAP